jgi:hypothetical protein
MEAMILMKSNYSYSSNNYSKELTQEVEIICNSWMMKSLITIDSLLSLLKTNRYPYNLIITIRRNNRNLMEMLKIGA